VKRRKILHNKDGAAATDYLSISDGEELVGAIELRPYSTGRSGQGCSREVKLVPLDASLHQEESIYSKRWIPTPWEVVRWSLRSLGLGILAGQQYNFTVRRFVVVENVELAAPEVLELQRSSSSSLSSSSPPSQC
jgi:charged multivesicular body protein 7